MGKIAERLALKRDPLYPRAKQILALACEVVRDDGTDREDELQDLIGDEIKRLDPEVFDRLMDLLADLSAPRRDGEEAMEVIEYATDGVAEIVDFPGATGGALGHLIALPLSLLARASAWHTRVTAEQSKAIGEVLLSAGLVAEGATVHVLPRLLSTGEASLMSSGTVHRMAQALAMGHVGEAFDLAAAAKSLLNVREALFGTETPVANEDGTPVSVPVGKFFGSVGVLVACVVTADAEPFPLAMMEAHEMIAIEDSDGESMGDALAGDDTDESVEARFGGIFDDVMAVLDGVGAALGKVLGVKDVTLACAPSGWFEDVHAAENLGRKLRALVEMNGTADLHTQGDLGGLRVVFGLSEDADVDCYEMDVHLRADRSDGARLAKLQWFPIQREIHEDSFHEALSFLKFHGLEFKGKGPFESLLASLSGAGTGPVTGADQDEDSFSTEPKAPHPDSPVNRLLH